MAADWGKAYTYEWWMSSYLGEAHFHTRVKYLFICGQVLTTNQLVLPDREELDLITQWEPVYSGHSFASVTVQPAPRATAERWPDYTVEPVPK